MARVSRPPGFDMTYKPARRASFGPPLGIRIPSYASLGITSLLAIAAWWAPSTSPGSSLHTHVVEGDRTRLVPALVIALVLCGSALAAVLRTFPVDGLPTRPAVLASPPPVVTIAAASAPRWMPRTS